MPMPITSRGSPGPRKLFKAEGGRPPTAAIEPIETRRRDHDLRQHQDAGLRDPDAGEVQDRHHAERRRRRQDRRSQARRLARTPGHTPGSARVQDGRPAFLQATTSTRTVASASSMPITSSSLPDYIVVAEADPQGRLEVSCCRATGPVFRRDNKIVQKAIDRAQRLPAQPSRTSTPAPSTGRCWTSGTPR